MNKELIDKLVKCVMDSAIIADTQGVMEARLPLNEAQNIYNKMTPQEIGAAEKKIVIAFLNSGRYGNAIAWMEQGLWKIDTKVLLADQEVKQAAAQAYQKAKDNQLEIVEDTKRVFEL